QPEDCLVLVVAGCVELLLHADGTALVTRAQAGVATEEAGVAAGVHHDTAGEVVRTAERITHPHPGETAALVQRPLDVGLETDLRTGFHRPRAQPLVGPAYVEHAPARDPVALGHVGGRPDH